MLVIAFLAGFAVGGSLGFVLHGVLSRNRDPDLLEMELSAIKRRRAERSEFFRDWAN